MPPEKTVTLDDGDSVEVVVVKSNGEKAPDSALGKKRNFEKRPTKPKRPPIPKLFQPKGPPVFAKDVPDDVKGVSYHSTAIKLKRNTQRRKREIVLDKLAPPTTIPQTHRSKSMLWLM